MLQNIRYACRQLRHSPEVTILAVMSLALGIGANTAMFTVVESVLLRPLPYAEPDLLMNVNAAGGQSAGALSWLDYLDVRNQSRSLATVAAYANDVGVIQTANSTLSISTAEITPNIINILGVHPMMGRTFADDEGQANGPQAVLISEELWRQTLGANRAVLGRNLRVNGHDRTIIGVMPKSFRFPESAGKETEKGLWLPMQPTADMLQQRGYDFLTILAKSNSSAETPRVQAELNLIAKHIRATDPGADPKLNFRALPYLETITGPVRPVFLALVAALGLVLLIVCANVANLLTARCIGRQHEFAVRAALGSGHGRLVAQMIAEAGMLSLLGCGLGLLLAYWITVAIHSLPPGIIPRSESIEVRWTVLLALGAIASLTTILSALLPALFIAGTDPQAALRAGSRSLSNRSLKARAGGWLIGGEVALSALLLIAAGLLFRTMWDLEHTRLGFDATNVTSFTAMPAGDAPASMPTTIYRPLLEALRQTPGFHDAALATAPPFSGFDLQTNFRTLGQAANTQTEPSARLTALSGRFQELLGTPVIHGRNITEQDTANSPFVAVINQTFAKKYFAQKESLGRQLDLGGTATGMIKPYTIVGVIGDQVDTSASQPPQPLLMLPYQQVPADSLYYPPLLRNQVHFLVKTRGNIAAAPVARAIFRRLAPDLAVDNFQTMQQAVDQSNFSSRLGFYLIGAFAGLAILMVIAGLYGVLSQVVSQRRREFGLRMALGATRQSIVRSVLLQSSGIVSIGLGVGITLASFLGRMVQSFLYGVKPMDTATYAFAIVALFLVGAGAALVPAWRAASFEPVKALRDE